MQIVFGATVVSTIGEEESKVSRVLIDPTASLLSHLVATAGAGDDARAIPIWAVERADGYEVFLKADAPEMEQLPVFRTGKGPGADAAAPAEPLTHEPGDFPALYPEDGSLPGGAVALSANTRLRCGEEPLAGRLVGVEADDYTAEATILYVRLEGEAEKTVAAPMAWARAISGKQVNLACTSEDLRGLPDSPLSAPGSPIEPLQRG